MDRKLDDLRSILELLLKVTKHRYKKKTIDWSVDVNQSVEINETGPTDIIYSPSGKKYVTLKISWQDKKLNS